MNLVIATLMAAVLATSPAVAQTPEEKGYAIAAKSDRLDNGYGTSIAKLEMTLTNAAGKSTSRTLEIRSQEKPNEEVGDKSVTLFFTPPDVEGTALLSHAKILESDDQWLYLPEITRVKRISSSNKSGPFVGSEFAFEDLTATELGKYDYRYIESKQVDGMMMDIVEQTPRYERSGYTKLVAYYDQKINQLRKVEYYNRGGSHFKTLTQSDFKNYGGTIFRALTQTMKNHLTGKSTVLKANSYEFGVTLNENDFKPNSLTRL